MDGVVLVLNQNYEPLNVCNLPRAFRLVFGEKAEVIEYDHQVIRTPRTEYRAPSVIRLQHLIRRPRPRVKLSRREVFVRDRHTCQYCGRQAHDMAQQGTRDCPEAPQLRWASENGIRELVTWTQDGNVAMQRVNTRLGYVARSVSHTVRRDLP